MAGAYYNPDIHQRRSIRLKYDYTRKGMYFLTVCTQNRDCAFGDIINGAVRLSLWGELALHELLATQQHRNNMRLHEYVVMQNHVHGIVEIIEHPSLDTARRVPTARAEQFACPVAGSIPTFVRSCKAAITRQIRQNGNEAFAWQKGYFEHIVRNRADYLRIAEYIENNPANWKHDRFYYEGA